MSTLSIWVIYATLIGLSSTVFARNFTLTNNCPYTIWPAMLKDPNAGAAVPDAPSGWEAPPGDSRNFFVPNNWKSGRIWARRDCHFSDGVGECASASCAGGLECTGSGAIPATLAEFNMAGDEPGPYAFDSYDVSLVDGYNIPLRIVPTGGCPSAECAVNLEENCPEALRGPSDSDGNNLGCNVDCAIETNMANSPSCCTGQYGTRETCLPAGIPNYNYFKDNCPRTYVYPFDEISGTAMFTCKMEVNADYTLTFCP